MKKIFFILCIIFTALASITRYIAYMYNFDGTFFTDGDMFAWITIFLCIIPSIYPFFLYFKKRNLRSVFRHRVDVPTKIFTLLITVFAITSGYFAYQQFIIGGGSDVALITSVSLVEPFMMLSLVFSVYLIIVTVLQLFDKVILFKKLKFMELIPVLWGIVLLVYLYIYYASSLRITEDVISIMASASLMLALLNRGKIIAGMDENRDCYKKALVHTSTSFSMWVSLCVSELILLTKIEDYELFIPIEIVLMCACMSGLLLVFCMGNNFKHTLSKVTPRGGTRFKKKQRRRLIRYASQTTI